MKLAIALLAAGALIGGTTMTLAQSAITPGHEMQDKDSLKSKPASDATTAREKGSPGLADRDRDDKKVGDRDDKKKETTGRGEDRDDKLRDRDDRRSAPQRDRDNDHDRDDVKKPKL